MYTSETVSIDVFADDFERYYDFCCLRNISTLDGLSVLMDMAGVGSVDDMWGSVSVPNSRPVVSSDGLPELIERAEGGEFSAIIDLSSLYLYCEDVFDPEAAYVWACRGAETGSPKAFYLAGSSAYICKRYDDAFSWFEHGARLKHGECEFMLGICYALGQGCERDVQVADELLCRAGKKNLDILGVANDVFDRFRSWAE